jgi:hypothetical protein
MVRLLSFGGGVQTSYLLFKYPERYDAVIFADVGAGDREHAENQITYWILDNLVKQFCIDHNLPFHIRDDGKSLWDYAMNEKIIPVRFPRWCTDKKKKRVIRKFMRTELHAKRVSKKDPLGNVIDQDIGFTVDESHRMKIDLEEPQYVKSYYPLITDYPTTRQQCIDWLNQNYPIVMNGNNIDWKDAKSGCWFCMFAKKKEVDNYTSFQKSEIIKLEKNGKRYPELTIRAKPMEEIFNNPNQTLDDYESCDEGYCFV